MSHPVELMAWAPPQGGAALVLAAKGFQLPDDGTMIQVPAPEGFGLHVWTGELDEQGVFSKGCWRRASAQDMEDWGMPVSEKVDPEPKWCCAMRRKFLIGIIGHDPSMKAPVELADFVTEWTPKIVIRIKFCPFCGVGLTEADNIVRTEVG